MAFKIYKPGQGKWVRLGTAIGIGLMTAFGVYWLLEELRGAIETNAEYWLGGIAAVIVAVMALFTWWLLNKIRIVDFMVATETEMQKVAWPTKKEIVNNTWVVIAGTLLIVAVLFIVDIGFATLFKAIRILEG